MASDGSVVFSTELDESGLKSALQGLGGKIATWTKAAGVALAGVSAGLGALAKKAFSYNSQMEDYQTNFAVLLGDEAKAMEHVAHLRERAAKTPFGMEDLAGASQTMLSFGLSAEKSSQTMEQLGDIALGDKSKFQMLTLAFSQISAAGKLAGQDLLQMVNAGFNPLNTIAEKTGTNLGDLKEVMAGGKGSDDFQKQMKAAQDEVAKLGDQASDGAKLLAQIGKDGYISAEMVGKAMEIETAPGGRFYNGMQKASQTMSGMISTLKDDADALVGEVFAPMTEQIGKTMIPMAQGYLQQLTGAFQSGGTSGLITTLGDVLGDAVGKISGRLPSIVSLAAKIITSLTTALAKNARTIAKGIASALTAAVKGLTPVIPELLTGAVIILSELFMGLTDELPQLIEGLTEALIGGIMTLIENAPALLDAGAAIIQAIGAGISNAIPMIFDSIPGILQSALNLISDVWSNRIWPVIQSLFKAVFGIEVPEWNEIVTKISTWWENNVWPKIQNFFLTMFGIEIPNWEDTVSSIKTWWGKVWDAVQNLWTVIFSVFTEDESGQGAIGRITAWWEKVKAAIAEYFKAVFGIELPDVVEDIKTWWDDVKTKIAEFFNATFSINFPDVVEEIRTWWDTQRESVEEFFKVTLGIGGPTKEEEAAFMAGAPEGITPEQHKAYSDNFSEEGFQAAIMAQQDAEGAKQAYEDAAPGINTARQDALTPDEGTSAPTPMTESADIDVSGAIDAINNGATGIANSAKDAVDGANKAAMTKTQQSSNVGYQLAAGVASGVNMGAPLLYSAINSMMQKAYQGARKFAQIASPSRLFANGIGAFLPSGAAMGVESNAWKLRKAVNDMIADSMPQEGFELGLNVKPGYTQGQTVATQMAPAWGLGVGWARAAGSSDAFGAGGGSFQQVNNFNVPVQTPDEFAKTMRLYATYGMEGAI